METTSILALIISALALSISTLTLWLTHFRRGRVIMTRPTVIFLGPDGSRNEGLNGNPKIFLRTLLISNSKRERIVQNLYATLAHKETLQNFGIWVYGDNQLVRGSGLYVNDTGIAANHHFLISQRDKFEFREGSHRLEVFTQVLGDKHPVRLLSQILDISVTEAAELATGQCGLYFDWGPQASGYHSYIDRKPPRPNAFDDVLTMLMERSNESGAIPQSPPDSTDAGSSPA